MQGSSYFRDHHNLCLFGGFKSGTFGASGKVMSENFVLFPEHASQLDGIYPNTNGPTGTRSGACVQVLSNPGEEWSGNICVTTTAGPAACKRLVGGNNSYFCRDPAVCSVQGCQASGHELGSTTRPMPVEGGILRMVKDFVRDMPV